jgi:AraC-like DNA-binding protein
MIKRDQVPNRKYRDMSIGTDTFSRFLAVVADGLHGEPVDGEEVARRAHMSRFHFDRLVSAASGETPAAFRRRISLERAAFQLLDGRPVLEVALTAGYGSHEAFTRAFSRAYGSAPSMWRHRPGPSLALPAPSGVHFHPPGGLLLPARTKVTAMNLLERVVAHHVWLAGEILDRVQRLERTDPQVLDRPIEMSVEYIEDDMTLRRATSRLVGQLAMWNAAVAGRPYDIDAERGESVADMRARLDAAGPEFLALVETLVREGRLDETFVDAICDPPQVFTFGGMLAHVVTFGAVRRTFVIGALHTAGITDLGAGDPAHWVAEAQG